MPEDWTLTQKSDIIQDFRLKHALMHKLVTGKLP